MRLDHLLSKEEKIKKRIDEVSIYTVQFSLPIEAKKRCGDIAQLGEHLPCKQGVMSSNLIISTIKGTGSGEISASCSRRLHIENCIM